MVCPTCGNPVGSESKFCQRCGAAITAAPAGTGPGAGPGQPVYAAMPPAGAGPVGAWPQMMVVPRVQRHLQTLAYLWLGFAVFRFVSGLMGAFFCGRLHGMAGITAGCGVVRCGMGLGRSLWRGWCRW